MADKPQDGKPEDKTPSWKERLKKAYDQTSKKGKELYKEAKKGAEVFYEDAKKNAEETLETLSVLTEDGQKKEAPKEPGPEPKTLKEKLNAAAKKVKETDWKAVGERVKKTDWGAVAKDTSKEITKKDELKKLVGSIIIFPGGSAVYAAYRVAKHHKEMEEKAKLEGKTPANENKKPEEAKPAPEVKAEEEKVQAPTRRKRPPRPPRNPAA